MEILPIEVFGIHVDIPFPAPVGLRQAGLEEFAARLCEPAFGLNLRAELVRLKKWDDLFGYELAANFFGENGTLTRTAERVKFGIRNARTAADWNIMHRALARLYEQLDCDPETLSTLSTHAHAKFPSDEDRAAFLEPFVQGAPVRKAGALGYVQIADWEKDIRVLMEPSNVVPHGLFIAWDTQFSNGQEWDSFLSTLPTMMENAANLFALGFEPLREKV